MINKLYKIRTVGSNHVITVPTELIKQEADKCKVDVKYFLKHYYALLNYQDGIAHYTFIEPK